MSEVKLKIYMADEIWAGREYNPKEIPMGMQFVTKEDYDKLLTRTPEAQWIDKDEFKFKLRSMFAEYDKRPEYNTEYFINEIVDLLPPTKGHTI